VRSSLDLTAIEQAVARLHALRTAAEQRLATRAAQRRPPTEPTSGPTPPTTPTEAVSRAFVALFGSPTSGAAAQQRLKRVRFAPAALAPADAVRHAGSALCARRERLGLSQRQVAEAAHLSRSALAELERREHGSGGLRLLVAATLERLETVATQAERAEGDV
jgi:helix-turn-helix protein